MVPVCSNDDNDDNDDPHKKIIRRENEKTIFHALDEYLFCAQNNKKTELLPLFRNSQFKIYFAPALFLIFLIPV